MKIQIRQGVFETNSSSQHSLSIMNRDMFIRWKNGEVLARMTRDSEAKNCWSNFWSTLYNFEFTEDKEKAKKDNDAILKHCIELGIARENEYKIRCHTHKKRIERELSRAEIEALSDKEQQKYYDDLYEDDSYYFDEEDYNYWMKVYSNLNWDNFSENFSKLSEHCWITYEEFMKELKVDCYSPFEHDDPVNNVHIIGKYFHS
jgi:hypothetical protein